uniref:Uncharacterized protein n=1 Tax=Corethron hystrix TaxID=216773 RepID=A0A6U5H5I5_9STRA|mmetsp:Transcript_28421/g.65019  ORF Transcript_28421/g.65019 Transcript_28421/m.65019 type:complete len:146 (+) Transcript_28421:80-517(+)
MNLRFSKRSDARDIHSENPNPSTSSTMTGSKQTPEFTKNRKRRRNPKNDPSEDTKPTRHSVATIEKIDKKNITNKDGITQTKAMDIRKNGQRNSRGVLIPKRRIDIEMKLDGIDALMQRAAKNRKNKKKQKRDSALTDFARRTMK